MMDDLRFHLSRLLTSSCVFSRSGGTGTELADLGPPVGLQSRGCCSLIWVSQTHSPSCEELRKVRFRRI